MAVIEHQLIRVLGEAGFLLLPGLHETIVVELDVETASEENRPVMQDASLVAGHFLDDVQIFVETGTVQAGLIQVLRRTHERSGLAPHCGPQRAEITAGLGSQEDQCLLRAGWNRDYDSLFADVFVPGFNFREPVFGWRIGRTAQECGDHQETNGLPVRHVGMDPEAITRLEVGHAGNRQGLARPGHPYFYSWPR